MTFTSDSRSVFFTIRMNVTKKTTLSLITKRPIMLLYISETFFHISNSGNIKATSKKNIKQYLFFQKLKYIIPQFWFFHVWKTEC
jgi:hypothetical protein